MIELPAENQPWFIQAADLNLHPHSANQRGWRSRPRLWKLESSIGSWWGARIWDKFHQRAEASKFPRLSWIIFNSNIQKWLIIASLGHGPHSLCVIFACLFEGQFNIARDTTPKSKMRLILTVWAELLILLGPEEADDVAQACSQTKIYSAQFCRKVKSRTLDQSTNILAVCKFFPRLDFQPPSTLWNNFFFSCSVCIFEPRSADASPQVWPKKDQ